MAVDDMKQDATVTINWFRMNVPTLALIVAATVSGAAWQSRTDADVKHLQYRIDQSEKAVANTNVKLDNLYNTLISQLDLIRRDLNRLTTSVEVISTEVRISNGEPREAKQRRTRPGPKMPEDLEPH